MHGNTQDVQTYAFAIDAALAGAPPGLTCVYCPPEVYLSTVAKRLPKHARLVLGAQNCHTAITGAFTGETSAAMLADIGCRYVILGHSERRAAGETDATVAVKAKTAIAAGLMPILCVGESQEAYEAKKTTEVLGAQLDALKSLAPRSYLVAYEPIWAIGSGATPAGVEIASAHRYIKSVLGSATPVLYGGSVNAGNAQEILSLSEVSGALIGTASLAVSSMGAIIAAAMAE